MPKAGEKDLFGTEKPAKSRAGQRKAKKALSNRVFSYTL